MNRFSWRPVILYVLFVYALTVFTIGFCLAAEKIKGKVSACTATAIPFIYSFSGNSAASAPISTFTCLWVIYIFPESVHIFPPAEKADPSWEYICNSLTDTWMWKLGLRPRYSFSGNICFKFSAFCLCKVLPWNYLLILKSFQLPSSETVKRRFWPWKCIQEIIPKAACDKMQFAHFPCSQWAPLPLLFYCSSVGIGIYSALLVHAEGERYEVYFLRTALSSPPPPTSSCWSVFYIPERSFIIRYSFLLISNKFCDKVYCIGQCLGRSRLFWAPLEVIFFIKAFCCGVYHS